MLLRIAIVLSIVGILGFTDVFDVGVSVHLAMLGAILFLGGFLTLNSTASPPSEIRDRQRGDSSVHQG